MQSSNDHGQIPPEWESSELPPPPSHLAPLSLSQFPPPPPKPLAPPIESRPIQWGELWNNSRPIQPDFPHLYQLYPDRLRVNNFGSANFSASNFYPDHFCLNKFHQISLRWGIVTIVAATVAQASFSLFSSIIAPTFAQKIEQARMNRVGTKISAMNQAQRVHFLDHGAFSPALVALDLGITSQGQYYDYQVQTRSLVHRRHDGAIAAEAETTQPQIVVSLASPRQPGLPTVWGAIQAQGSDRITDSLICKKPAAPTSWPSLLRQQFRSTATRHRSSSTMPVVPPRLECPIGFEPISLPTPF